MALLVVVCVLLIILTHALESAATPITKGVYVPIHLLLELVSIVVSLAVFTTGWYGYKQTGNSRDLLIGVVFLATGVTDLIHALSYQGMPDFLGDPSAGKAAAYWVLSRLIVGVGLLGASLIRPPFKVRWLTPALLLAASALIIGGFVAVATLTEPAFGNLFYNPITKLTSLKIGLEILAMTFYATAFVALTDSRGWTRRSPSTLRAALLVAIFAELAFTLYQTVRLHERSGARLQGPGILSDPQRAFRDRR